MYLHKSGVSLRKIDRSDLQDLLKLKQESWWGTHGTLIANIEDQNRWYETTNDLFLMLMKGEEKIGFAGFTNIDWFARKASVTGSLFRTATKRDAAVSRDCWCSGFDFAFEILNLRRLEVEVVEYNLPSQKLNIGLMGMRVEGVKRESVYKSGRYYNSLVLGLLRDEWVNSPRVLEYGGSCNQTIDHSLLEKLVKRSRS